MIEKYEFHIPRTKYSSGSVIGRYAYISRNTSGAHSIAYEFHSYNPAKGPSTRTDSWELQTIQEYISDLQINDSIKKGKLKLIEPEMVSVSLDRFDKIED